MHDRAWHGILEERIKALTEHNECLEQVIREAARILMPLAEHDPAIREWLAQLATVGQVPPTGIEALALKEPE